MKRSKVDFQFFGGVAAEFDAAVEIARRFAIGVVLRLLFGGGRRLGNRFLLGSGSGDLAAEVRLELLRRALPRESVQLAQIAPFVFPPLLPRRSEALHRQ